MKTKKNNNYFTRCVNSLKEAYRGVEVGDNPHYVTAGHELECLVTEKLLKPFLPSKYAVHTNCFVRSLEKPNWKSNEIDILFTRDDIGFPLESHETYKIFPMESIVSFMEVTKTLDLPKLREEYAKVADLQRLNKRFYYVPKPPAGLSPCLPDAPRPRFYYFAFSSDWKTLKDIEKPGITKQIIEQSNEYGVQLHAIFVLEPAWCLVMPNADPRSEKPYSKLHVYEGLPESIMYFLQVIIMGLQSADFIPPNATIPFVHYFEPDFRLPE